MNIFYLHKKPMTAARMHCDKHVVKMILESAQMLSTAHRILDGNDYADRRGLYKATHKNHPANIWVRESAENYVWLYNLFTFLCIEYTTRYNKLHKTSRLTDALASLPNNIGDAEFTDPPQCMPKDYKQEDTVEAYRDYYCGEKASFAKWKDSKEPEWFYDAKSSHENHASHWGRYNRW